MEKEKVGQGKGIMGMSGWECFAILYVYIYVLFIDFKEREEGRERKKQRFVVPLI